MDDSVRAFKFFLEHDPYVIGGLLLIGLACWLFMHIQLRMLKLGYRSYSFFKVNPTATNGWDMPGEYLKVRREHGWSPWPVYLLWPSLVAGVATFVVGLFRF